MESDGEKDKLRGEIACLQEKAQFFEGWSETLSATNQQLKHEKDTLVKELEDKKQEHEAQIEELKEKNNSVIS